MATLSIVGRQFFCAMVVEWATERKFYVLAEGVPYNGAIDLVFRTATEPFGEILSQGMHEKLFESILAIRAPNAKFTSAFGTSSAASKAVEEKRRIVAENNQVERVFINLNIPGIPPASGDNLESFLIRAVSDLVKKIFPHLNPKQSIFLVHDPLRSYIANDELSLGTHVNSPVHLVSR